jgi:hypothetical protein
MKAILPAAFVIALSFLPALSVSALSEKETMEVLNSVSKRVSGGDIKALDEVKNLATNDAVAGFLFFFRQNHYTFNGPDWQHAIANKAALMATEVPGADAYFKQLFKKTPTPRTGNLVRQREVAIDALTQIHNKFSVRVLAEALLDPELDARQTDICVGLSKMNIAGAPYSKTAMKGTTSPEGIVKWTQWWTAHKAEY